MSHICPIRIRHVVSMPSWQPVHCLNWYGWRYTNRSTRALHQCKELYSWIFHRFAVFGIWQGVLHQVQYQSNNSFGWLAHCICGRTLNARFLSDISLMVRRWGRAKSTHLRKSRFLRQLPPLILGLVLNEFMVIMIIELAIMAQPHMGIAPCTKRGQRKLPPRRK